jgi:hypothetical protein
VIQEGFFSIGIGWWWDVKLVHSGAYLAEAAIFKTIF